MSRQLYAVQRAALSACNGADGFAYFMEQGLGKTGVILREFLDMVAERKATRMVVFCPNSFKGGWVDEAAEWDIDLDFHIYESGNIWANNIFLKKKFTKPPVLLVNFEAARSEKTQNYIQMFTLGRVCMAVVDESIQISTFDAAQTKAIIQMGKAFKYKRILSGKPMKQGPHDLWSQMRFLGLLEGRNYFSFKTTFCKMGGFKNKSVVGAMNSDVLAELIDPHVFRATKTDWTDLPPKVYNTREYQMSPEMAQMYRDMEEEFVLWLSNDQLVTVEAAITKYIKLAQIQAGFIFDEHKKVHSLVAPDKNPRLNLLQTLLGDEIPGKAVVVYNHKPVRDMLAVRFEKMRPVFIHGNMTDEEISANKRTFNNDRNCRIICITKAAKYGHTLLGDQSSVEHACSDMVFLENTYSLDDRSQLEDRSHRHGQEQEFMRYWDLVGTPLDKSAVKALQRKESVFQAVFSLLRKTGV